MKKRKIVQLECLQMRCSPGCSHVGSGAVGRRLIVLHPVTSRLGLVTTGCDVVDLVLMTVRADCYITLTYMHATSSELDKGGLEPSFVRR